MLLGHSDLTRLPAVPDRGQGGDDDVAVHVQRVGPRHHRPLQHLPRPAQVALEQAVLEALVPGGAFVGRGLGRSVSVPVLEQIEVGGRHAPGSPLLVGGKQTQSHVPVGSHVMHAQAVGGLVERQKIAHIG